MMPAAFGPVLPATSRITVMLVYAEETASDFVREVSESTRYAVKSDHRGRRPLPPQRPLQPEGRGGLNEKQSCNRQLFFSALLFWIWIGVLIALPTRQLQGWNFQNIVLLYHFLEQAEATRSTTAAPS